MHWFWRMAWASFVATLAFTLGMAAGAVVLHLTGLYVLYPLGLLLVLFGSQCVAVLVFHDPVGPVSADGETRCRKCRYILRGITEPRCPECGERI